VSMRASRASPGPRQKASNQLTRILYRSGFYSMMSPKRAIVEEAIEESWCSHCCFRMALYPIAEQAVANRLPVAREADMAPSCCRLLAGV
jgi:hypothetical protein